MIHAEVVNLENVSERIRLFQDKFSAMIPHVTKEAIKKTMFRDAKELCPKRTGTLSRSIDWIELPGTAGVNGVYTISFGPGVFYGRYVEFGTSERGEFGRPTYSIRPRTKKALYWKGLPHPIKMVKRHPGMKSRPFMRPAFDKNKTNLPLQIEADLRERLFALGFKDEGKK